MGWKPLFALLALVLAPASAHTEDTATNASEAAALRAKANSRAKAVLPHLLAWRRDIHQNALDPKLRFELHEVVKQTAVSVAQNEGATAEVEIRLGYPITYNDPALVDRMLPTLRRVAGARNVIEVLPRTGAEDFSFFSQKTPGFVRPRDTPEKGYAPNHSPRFFVDESALPVGVRAVVNLTLDYLSE